MAVLLESKQAVSKSWHGCSVVLAIQCSIFFERETELGCPQILRHDVELLTR